MKRLSLIAGAMVLAASAAQAASSDYLLKIEDLPGESKVASWSFGACNSACASSNAPRDVATGQASGKRQHGAIQASQNTQSLRESPTRASTGKTSVAPAGKASWDLATNKGARVATGDLDGDGQLDLAAQDAVSSFTVQFGESSPDLTRVCQGKHIAKATLRSSADSYELSDVTVSCTMDSGLAMTLTGGQMKHTKTGHVTLLK